MSEQAIAVNTAQNTMPEQTAQQRPSRYTPEQIAAAAIPIELNIELPSLQNHVPIGVPLQETYWSPEQEGESKKGWILGFETKPVADMETGELKMLRSVLFVEETPDGKKARFYNASVLLISTVEGAISRREIHPGNLLYPVKITYTGIKKCKNGKKASNWEILPLVIGG